MWIAALASAAWVNRKDVAALGRLLARAFVNARIDRCPN